MMTVQHKIVAYYSIKKRLQSIEPSVQYNGFDSFWIGDRIFDFCLQHSGEKSCWLVSVWLDEKRSDFGSAYKEFVKYVKSECEPL